MPADQFVMWIVMAIVALTGAIAYYFEKHKPKGW